MGSLVASIGAPLVGGLIGQAISGPMAAQSAADTQLALQNIGNINNPTAAQLQVALQQLQATGQISPQMEAAIGLGPSAMNGLSTAPNSAQMQALQSLQQQGKTGLSQSDITALNQIKNQTNQQAQANEQSVIQNMQQRGQGGSGAELAAQLSNAQNAANTASNQGMSIAGQAQQNALNAIANSGALGGQMQATQFGQQAQIANANDIISKYNAMNQQQVGNQNTAATNAAQAANTQYQQGIAAQNTGIANQQALLNSQAIQQAYGDSLNKGQALANAAGQAAGGLNQQASNTQTLYGGLGQSVGNAIGTNGLINAINNKTTGSTGTSAAPSTGANYFSVLGAGGTTQPQYNLGGTTPAPSNP